MWKALLPHLVAAAVLAGVIVAMPMGQVLGFVPWVVVVALVCGSEKGVRRTAALATYVAVTVLVVVAAILAPVKAVDEVLDRTVYLPKAALTLREMDWEANPQVGQWVTCPKYVQTTKNNADTKITFRATEITLREFIQTIEDQSPLRHNFRHCGTCSSILFGGDCCFGVTIKEPTLHRY
jgi:hypothetical protein